jgi:transcriptional regulator with XRE-family HTH domain
VDLGRRLGRSQSFVSKYEAGERRLYFHEVRQICRALGVGFDEFVEEFESTLRSR